MSNFESQENIVYEVLVNEEEQYSLWLQDREVPLGWKKVGKQGGKDECMAFIDEVWIDMRPLSLRLEMTS